MVCLNTIFTKPWETSLKNYNRKIHFIQIISNPVKGIVQLKLLIIDLPSKFPNLYEFISPFEYKRKGFKNAGNQTADGSRWHKLFFYLLWKSMATVSCLFTSIFIIHVVPMSQCDYA